MSTSEEEICGKLKLINKSSVKINI